MAQYLSETAKKVTTLCVRQMKAQGEKISMLTSYDYTTAGIVDAAGIDIILVGDSRAGAEIFGRKERCESHRRARKNRKHRDKVKPSRSHL